MLKFHGFLASCVKIHKSGYIIPGFPFKWEKNLTKLKVLKRHSWKVWLMILAILSIGNGHSVWHFQQEKNVTQFSLGMVSMTGLIVAFCILLFTSKHAESTARFLNGLMEMERYVQKQGLLHSYDELADSKKVKMVCKVFVKAVALAPWLMGVGSVVTPCSPPNLLAPLIANCKNSSHKYVTLLLIFGFNIIFWKAIFETGVLGSIHILIGCKCQATCLKILKRSAQKVNFVLYRKLQILGTLFNESHVGILVAALVGACVIQTCILYILFQAVGGSAGNSMSISAPVLIWNVIFVGITSLIILYIFGVAGSLHVLSKESMKGGLVSETYTPRERNGFMIKWKREFLRSCAPIKVAFGTSNFVENTTPLKFLDFSLNRFVDLLLMGKMK